MRILHVNMPKKKYNATLLGLPLTCWSEKLADIRHTVLLIEADAKLPPFHRRYFQIHFLE